MEASPGVRGVRGGRGEGQGSVGLEGGGGEKGGGVGGVDQALTRVSLSREKSRVEREISLSISKI